MKNIKNEYIKLVCGTNKPNVLLEQAKKSVEENIRKEKADRENSLKNMISRLTT